MEQQTDHDHNYHQPRNTLNFNAPLLSTRRPANSASLELSCPSIRCRNSTSGDAHHRIPFSWEKAPGKPKDEAKSSTRDDENDTPRPKLPPSLWRYQQFISTATTTTTTTTTKNVGNNDDDDGCDGYVDDHYNDDDEYDVNDGPDYDIFSDAVDVLSLSEAIDIAERSQKAQESSATTDGLRLKIIEESRRDNQYPDFIIQRFLPDAAALATASALSAMSLKKSCDDFRKSQMTSSSTNSERVSTTTSYSSPKGCGLELFFPWRMKHRLCGSVKSPVRRGSTFTSGVQLRRSHNKKNGRGL